MTRDDNLCTITVAVWLLCCLHLQVRPSVCTMFSVCTCRAAECQPAVPARFVAYLWIFIHPVYRQLVTYISSD